jgi:deoxyribodipyrimidine photo-lyase
MQSSFSKGLVWFRRDLRSHDNAALARATACCDTVICVFVYDTAILDALPRQDRRVEFIHESLAALDADLQALRGRPGRVLLALHDLAETAIPQLATAVGADAVFTARDYEPAAVARDTAVQQQLLKSGRQLVLVKDQVIFEEREVLTQTGRPYGVFSPYHRAWLARIGTEPVATHSLTQPERKLMGLGELPHFQATEVEPSKTATSSASAASEFGPFQAGSTDLPALSAIGFEASNLSALGIRGGAAAGAALLEDFLPRMDRYAEARNFPSVKGPSYLGVHLRFGTVSLRTLVNLSLERLRAGSEGASVWLAELAWRDFYFQILANYPHVAQRAFKPDYDAIVWEGGEQAQALYQAWCEGRTGYPIVDAAMAQINQTGYMHNRLRMVAGSFLVKHLGLDWRWGERYFALQLNDFDLAANNGGWQWVASSGCDAQPYFRIFNPVTQSEKFDAQGKFIRRYLPQLSGLSDKAIHAPWLAKPLELEMAGVRLGDNYPRPVVDHSEARARTLARYGFLKKSADSSSSTSAQ